jgi:FAD:protein FMN transferase
MDTLISPCRRRLLLGTAGGLGALALGGCGPAATTAAARSFEGRTMGTGYHVKLAGSTHSPARLESLQADVQSALDGVDHAMSLYRPGSELMRLNRQPAAVPLVLSRGLFDVLATAQQVSELSQGAFDVSVAPLVNAWGFGPDRHRTRPPAAQLQAQLQAQQARQAPAGWRGLHLDAAQRTVAKWHGALQADLGGIAKGHGVDLAAQALDDAGIEHYMVEVGGEVRTRGRNAHGRAWQIGIEQPDAVPQRARRVLPLSGLAMATSGDYRIFFEQAGTRYSHAIDPHTAAPIRHGLASVTVVADSCMRADALATALIVLGPERGLALARRLGLPALFIVREHGGTLRDIETPAFAALAAAAGTA